MITLENLKLWQKHKLGLLPTRLAEIMAKDHAEKSLRREHAYDTRNENVLKRPRVQTRCYEHSLFVKGLSQYQNSPLNLRNLNSLGSFTKQAKLFILNSEHSNQYRSHRVNQGNNKPQSKWLNRRNKISIYKGILFHPVKLPCGLIVETGLKTLSNMCNKGCYR